MGIGENPMGGTLLQFDLVSELLAAGKVTIHFDLESDAFKSLIRL